MRRCCYGFISGWIQKTGKINGIVYLLNQFYVYQDDMESDEYNADTIIKLKEFPHIEMTLADIFENIK